MTQSIPGPGRAPVPRVVIESPLRGAVPAWVPRKLAPLVERFRRWRNTRYAFRCIRDSLARGEAPYASHVFFARANLLDDADLVQRELGMIAGFSWGWAADSRAVYCDRGISDGMRKGIAGRPRGQVVEYRYLYTPQRRRARTHCERCGQVTDVRDCTCFEVIDP